MKKLGFIFLIFLLSILLLGSFFYGSFALGSFTNKDVIVRFECTDCRDMNNILYKSTYGQRYTVLKTIINNETGTIPYKNFYGVNQFYNYNIDTIDKTLPLRTTTYYNINSCTNRDVVGTAVFLDWINISRPNDRISWFSVADGLPSTSSWKIENGAKKWSFNDNQKYIHLNYIFWWNGSKVVWIKDLAGNQNDTGKNHTLLVTWIDKNPASIDNLMLDKMGDSIYRPWINYPISFNITKGNIRDIPSKCREANGDVKVRYFIQVYENNAPSNTYNGEIILTELSPSAISQDVSIQMKSGVQYGIFLAVIDTAWNITKKTLWIVPSWLLPSDSDIISVAYPSFDNTNSSIISWWSTSAGDIAKAYWVRIIGLFQWQWQEQQILAWQEANTSLVQISSIRDSIRRNAYNLIRNRVPNSTINRVKYWEGDYTYTAGDNSADYDTLIIKNGNLAIAENITENKWFIILDEHLSGTYGNIFISSWVTDIKWVLFGEGRLDSIAWWRGSTKQLRILWSVLTRNTIGWSIMRNWEYLLPWWWKTTNKAEAELYDLNLIRSGNDWWNSIFPQYEEAFLIIRYNWENTSKPLPGFDGK